MATSSEAGAAARAPAKTPSVAPGWLVAICYSSIVTGAVLMVTTGLGIYVIYELLRHHQAEKSNEVVKPLSALAASWLAQKWWKVVQMNPMLMPMAFGSSVLCVALPVMRLQDHYAALALSATVKKDGKDRGKRKGNPGNQAEGKKTQ